MGQPRLYVNAEIRSVSNRTVRNSKCPDSTGTSFHAEAARSAVVANRRRKLSQTGQILATPTDKVYLNDSLNCLITFRLNWINECFNLNKQNKIPHLPDLQSVSTSCASSSFIVPQRTSSGVCMN